MPRDPAPATAAGARLLIAGAHRSSGKTTVAAGLCAALRARDLATQPFKKGPDYIDPMWLSAAAGRPCYNLDFHTMTAPEIVASTARLGQAADLAVIEGNTGLHDGIDPKGGDSNAALALLLDAPVLLVIDVRGMTRGVAPLILGQRAFDPKVRMAGVVLNRVRGARHESKLRAAIDRYTDVPVLGALHEDPALAIGERHLGLIPSNEMAGSEAKIELIAEAIAGALDLDRLLAVARTAGPLPPPAPSQAEPASATPPRVRIAVARDSAFGFYYPQDLEALAAAGAELVPFDTMRDRALPPADGLFIGGGFPETHAVALEANTALRADIRAAIEAGLPTYAECGGLMYLARSLTWGGATYDMVGVVPGDAVMHGNLRGGGYVRLKETGKGPWPLLDAAGRPAEVVAHEFHFSSIEHLGGGLTFAYKVLRGAGIDGRHDGIVYKNLLASYAHLRNVAGNRWAERFIGFVRARAAQGSVARPGPRLALSAPRPLPDRRPAAPSVGRVYLLGAGPGDPELLTTKAVRLLGEAEAVVYDRLVSSKILDLIPEGTARIFAGKAARRHTLPQGRINELLVELARGGQTVVRLKGGDPFVFGRGSEEARHLARNGIPFEVVPGVTAAGGCSAAAGIPLTHRGLASGVRFVTGHCRNGRELDLDWTGLADPDTTLVVYMGLTNIGRISRELIAAGLSGATPAAAVEQGTSARQRTLLTTLAELPERVRSADLQPPTLLIIGRVVALAHELGQPVLSQLHKHHLRA